MNKIVVLFFCFAMLILSSCSPKINGATKHRRDRNCGCERLDAKPYTPIFFDQTVALINQSNQDKLVIK